LVSSGYRVAAVVHLAKATGSWRCCVMLVEQVVIPMWLECFKKLDAGKELTAAEEMVFKYQPNKYEGRDEWRLALANVIAEAANGMRTQ
jgi:hypothetical protein